MPDNTKDDVDKLSDVEALAWQVKMGADEAIGEEPVDRTITKEAPPKSVREAEPMAPPTPKEPRPRFIDASKFPEQTDDGAAERLAAAAGDLTALEQAIKAFEGCSLKRTATNTVFADGNPDAGLMFVGEAPGADEDRQGRPFVGPSGQLLDRMLVAVGMHRTRDYYITNILPWRPPGNRKPTPVEAAICLPFLMRHIELAKPKVLVLLGGTAVSTLLDTTQGITRLRGRWHSLDVGGREIPVMPTYHPAYLLRQPQLKGDAWRDILTVLDKYKDLSH